MVTDVIDERMRAETESVRRRTESTRIFKSADLAAAA
jgi:hypothetical protein